MKKIIIRTPNFIGDTINTTPCLELIKQEYPEAEFTIVGPDFVRELFKYDPRITHYITFPLKRKKKLSTYWKIVRELRKENGEFLTATGKSYKTLDGNDKYRIYVLLIPLFLLCFSD